MRRVDAPRDVTSAGGTGDLVREGRVLLPPQRRARAAGVAPRIAARRCVSLYIDAMLSWVLQAMVRGGPAGLAFQEYVTRSKLSLAASQLCIMRRSTSQVLAAVPARQGLARLRRPVHHIPSAGTVASPHLCSVSRNGWWSQAGRPRLLHLGRRQRGQPRAGLAGMAWHGIASTG